MVIPESAVSSLVNSMLRMEKKVSIPGNIDIDDLLELAFKRCPKLDFIYKSGSCKTTHDTAFLGLLSYNHQNLIELEYELPYPEFKLPDVIEDNGSLDISGIIKTYKQKYKRYPSHLPISTQDPARIQATLQGCVNLFHSEFPGIEEITRLISKCSIIVNIAYKADPAQIYNMEMAASSEADKVIQILFGKSFIPPFLKVFLVFSYVQTNVKFDSMYIDCLKRGMKNLDIAPELPYCVLGSSAKRGISKGIAGAVSLLLNKAVVECITVQGQVLIEGSEDEYYWNMVKLNGIYYHLDATWFVDGKGINVARYMCDSHTFYKEHRWYIGTPEALGRTYNYDYVESFIDENFDSLIAAGVPEKYLRPEEIYD
ncbi:MAG: hypothetical protein LBT59_06395 [Clostridiales bacterium]|jgi:hypothetical protein|nr:hypothetical protein [Clostridiales bacterium]